MPFIWERIWCISHYMCCSYQLKFPKKPLQNIVSCYFMKIQKKTTLHHFHFCTGPNAHSVSCVPMKIFRGTYETIIACPASARVIPSTHSIKCFSIQKFNILCMTRVWNAAKNYFLNNEKKFLSIWLKGILIKINLSHMGYLMSVDN